MITLCLNTAEINAQIVLNLDEKIKNLELDSSLKHSENLLPKIEEILGGLPLEKLDYLAVNVGPGSFTGLRISIATAKALLLTQKHLKAIKINSFELMANNFFKQNMQNKANFVIDALSSLYFVCEMDRDFNVLSAPKMVEKNELINLTNIVSDKPIENISSIIVKTTCEDLNEVASKKIKNNQFCEEKELIPLYIRPSQAEAQKKAH